MKNVHRVLLFEMPTLATVHLTVKPLLARSGNYDRLYL